MSLTKKQADDVIYNKLSSNARWVVDRAMEYAKNKDFDNACNTFRCDMNECGWNLTPTELTLLKVGAKNTSEENFRHHILGFSCIKYLK